MILRTEKVKVVTDMAKRANTANTARKATVLKKRRRKKKATEAVDIMMMTVIGCRSNNKRRQDRASQIVGRSSMIHRICGLRWTTYR